MKKLFPFHLDFIQFYRIKEDDGSWSEDLYNDEEIDTIEQETGIRVEYDIVSKWKTFIKWKS